MNYVEEDFLLFVRLARSIYFLTITGPEVSQVKVDASNAHAH